MHQVLLYERLAILPYVENDKNGYCSPRFAKRDYQPADELDTLSALNSCTMVASRRDAGATWSPRLLDGSTRAAIGGTTHCATSCLQMSANSCP
jgi:hypothetical protein